MTRCLIIDEDPQDRQHMVQAIAQFVFIMGEAASAEVGLMAAQDTPPDMIMMKDAIGTLSPNFVRRLGVVSRGRPPVVIIYSSAPDAHTIGRMILDGASDYLVQPFNDDILTAKLQRHGLIDSALPRMTILPAKCA